MSVSTISDRIKAIRKALGVSQRDFCAGIFLSHSFYAKIETGARKPNERVCELICAKYMARKDWLVSGRGEMFGEAPPDVELMELVEIVKELDPLFRDCIIQQVRLMANLHRKSKERGAGEAP